MASASVYSRALARNSSPCHLGHSLIRQDHRHVRFRAEQGESFTRRGCRENAVLVLEQILQRDQNIRLVIDDQDHAIVPRCLAICEVMRVRLGIVMVKLGPPMGLSIDRDCSLVGLHDAIGYRQSKSSSGAHRLGGEKGFENPFPDIRGIPGPLSLILMP